MLAQSNLVIYCCCTESIGNPQMTYYYRNFSMDVKTLGRIERGMSYASLPPSYMNRCLETPIWLHACHFLILPNYLFHSKIKRDRHKYAIEQVSK